MHVYERWQKAGGLLRYGIPDFKMEKIHVERRIEQMQGEGVVFHCSADVGVNVLADKLVSTDAVVLTGEREVARPADPRPRAERQPFRRWIFCRSRTGA